LKQKVLFLNGDVLSPFMDVSQKESLHFFRDPFGAGPCMLGTLFQSWVGPGPGRILSYVSTLIRTQNAGVF